MKILWYYSTIALLTGMVKAQLSPTDRAVCDCYPDPHFRTWDSIYYNYQGGAELILCKGNVIDVFIRTQALPYYARIVSAAVHVHASNVTLEVVINSTCCTTSDGIGTPCDPKGGGAPGRNVRRLMATSNYYVNGIAPPSPPATIGPYPFAISSSPEEYTLDLGLVQTIKIDVYYQSLRVLMDLHGSVGFSCKGMCGDWASGALRFRNGTLYTVGSSRRSRRLTNTENSALGEEWTVKPTDPHYFVDAATCPLAYPDDPRPNDQLLAQAKDACNGTRKNGDAVFKDCVFDIMATGDVGWAQTPRYVEPEPQPPATDPVCVDVNSRCKMFKGVCMYQCDRKKYRCLSGLCRKRRDVKDYTGKPKGRRYKKNCSCAIRRRGTN